MTYFTRNQSYPLGVDLSQHNASWDGKQIPDFDQFIRQDPPVHFVAMRSGISWAYRDTIFPRYLEEAKKRNLCILPYHVLYPIAEAKPQMEHFLKILEGENLDDLRLVLDVELAQGKSKAHITKIVAESLEILKRACGRYPIIYSRALWVNDYLQVEDLPTVDWWLAQYIRSLEDPLYTPEYPCPPQLPKGVRQWLIHQTSQRAPAIGGVGHYMDYNRWNGSLEQLYAYFGRRKPQPKVCPIDQLPCERGIALNCEQEEKIPVAA